MIGGFHSIDQRCSDITEGWQGVDDKENEYCTPERLCLRRERVIHTQIT